MVYLFYTTSVDLVKCFVLKFPISCKSGMTGDNGRGQHEWPLKTISHGEPTTKTVCLCPGPLGSSLFCFVNLFQGLTK